MTPVQATASQEQGFYQFGSGSDDTGEEREHQHESLSAPPPRRDYSNGGNKNTSNDFTAEEEQRRPDEVDQYNDERRHEQRYYEDHGEPGYAKQAESLQQSDDNFQSLEQDEYRHHRLDPPQQEREYEEERQDELHSPVKQFSKPMHKALKTTFDLESQRHIEIEQTPEPSPAMRFSKMAPRPKEPETMSQHSQHSTDQYSRHGAHDEIPFESRDDPYTPQQQQRPPVLDRNAHSFDNLSPPQHSPGHHFQQLSSNSQLHTSYVDQQQNRNSQDSGTQGSPVDNFTKPVAIPNRSYDSNSSQQSQHSHVSPPIPFSGGGQLSGSYQRQLSTSHHSVNPLLGGPSPSNAPKNVTQGFSNPQTSASEPAPFPPQLSTSPQAAPNQTPAYSHPQPFQPPPVAGHQPLYSNHREAQPAQHVEGTSTNSNFPAGWQDEEDVQGLQSSTNPFSPDIQENQPYGQPPVQQQPSGSPAGALGANIRSLQEGSIVEGRTYSQRSSGSGKSPGEPPEKPSAIGRPTPPTQPSSQQSHHSTATHVSHQTHVSQQSQHRSSSFGTYQETPPYTHSNASPQSNISGYSHAPPPAIPPKQSLDGFDRDREMEQQEQQQRIEREQRAAAFSYQQHLQRHLVNASTSPGGVTGYGPPPIGAQKRDTAPRVTSPLSVRKNEPSNFPPPPQRRQQQQAQPQQILRDEEISPHSQNHQHSPNERKVSFGQGSNSGHSPKQSNVPNQGHGQTSPRDGSQRGSQYNGSPHGSNGSNSSQPYSPPRRQHQPLVPSPPPGEEQSRQPPPLVTNQPQPQRYIIQPLLTSLSDGPAPPPAPSCPPPDTPGNEQSGQRGPPGGFLRSMALGTAAGGPGYKNYMGLPLMGKRVGDSREHGEGGTPTGFLGRKNGKGNEGRGPPPLGARPRNASSSGSGLGKMERPGSAEGDDPIPPEYRPRGEKQEGTISATNSKDSGMGLGLEDQQPPLPQQQQSNVSPTAQMQQVRGRPAVIGLENVQRSPEKFAKTPPQPGSQQRSPAEVGLGGYLYSKPIPPPSVGNSGTSNPRFPGGQITSPLTHTTSPPGNIGTRESVMRGQWVDGTAAVSGPAPVRKDDRPSQPQMSTSTFASYENSQKDYTDSGVYNAYTQNFQKPQSMPEPDIPEDVDENVTNPSESPTPDIPQFQAPIGGGNGPHPEYSKRGMGSEEALFASLSDLLPGLPPVHINALLNFALYLREDALVAEKAEKVRLTAFDAPGTKEQLSLLGDQRVRRWKEWVKMEEVARTRQLTAMTAPPESSPQQRNPFHGEDTEEGVRYEGMQPLPPPPSLHEFGTHHLKRQPHARPYTEMPEIQHEFRDQTPSPTPTVDQVAAAPKVDLELQMPRPMPSVPAIRIDPSTRRKFEDDASTVVSDGPSRAENRDGTFDIGLPGGTPYPFPFPKRQDIEFTEGRPVDTKVLSQVISSFTKSGSSDGEIMADIPPFLHMAYAALDKATNVAPLDQYLENARKLLEQKTQSRITVFQQNAMKRQQLSQNHTTAAYNSGRFTFADIERMRETFEAEEAKNKLELDAELYALFENEYVEVAYKEIKSQLEELGGRWYEEVKNWLFGTAPSPHATALEFHLRLEAIDLLNKLHATMEQHEHILQSLVTDRNARYLHISVAPLLHASETVRAADAERRYWIDEQERQIRSKIERGKRVAEHRNTIQQITDHLITALRKRYGEVLEAVWTVVWQFPPTIQPTLLRKFFDENTLPLPTPTHSNTESYTLAAENISALTDAVATLADIVGVIKLALEFRHQPAIRVVEAQLAIQIAEEHARANGVTAPTATATACAKGVKGRLPAALKRVGDECRREADGICQGLVEVLERLRLGVEEVERRGGRVDATVANISNLGTSASAVSFAAPTSTAGFPTSGGGGGSVTGVRNGAGSVTGWRGAGGGGGGDWERGSGEAWVTASAGYTPAPNVQQQQQRGLMAGGVGLRGFGGGF